MCIRCEEFEGGKIDVRSNDSLDRPKERRAEEKGYRDSKETVRKAKIKLKMER